MTQERIHTERLYYKDSHQDRMTAVVISCTSKDKLYIIELDQTVFFPEGGGQPADTGRLILDDGKEIIVHHVSETDAKIFHITDDPIAEGTRLTGVIDWEARFQSMQQHSGEHIFSGLMHRTFDCDNIGFHMGQDAVTMDFNCTVTMEDLKPVERIANDVIYQNLNIESTFPSKQELTQMEYRSKKELLNDVRIVTIPGYDSCACCAPHVKRTGEIGIIKILSAVKYKKGTRVSMLCGKRAFLHFVMYHAQITGISTQLSVKPEMTLDGVLRQKEEAFYLKGQLMELQKELLLLKLEHLPMENEHICVFEKAMATNLLRDYCNELMKRQEGICAVFGLEETGHYNYIIGSKHIDVRTITKAINQAFQGRGGGTSAMTQGSIFGTEKEIHDFIEGYIDSKKPDL